VTLSIATSSSWKRTLFTEGVPLPLRAHFGSAQRLKIQAGLIPEVMEDKWFVYFEAPYLFFHRSWTGQPVYRVELATDADGATVIEALWSADLAGVERADPIYQAQLLNFLICNLLLGQSKPFPRPDTAQESAPGLFQHHVAGTGYREVSVKPSGDLDEHGEG
jgi:hypothetical protein